MLSGDKECLLQLLLYPLALPGFWSWKGPNKVLFESLWGGGPFLSLPATNHLSLCWFLEMPLLASSLLPSHPNSSSPPALGIWQSKVQSLLQPPPHPNWQLLACCLCPDMAKGHWQLGDGVYFPLGSMERGRGEAWPPLGEGRGQGGKSRQDTRLRENVTFPACGGHWIKKNGPGHCA